ncbi:restriction endonuclease subunit S [Penaeicola halotolerans]|uniref:restriction endonuclease subunit S n=1 Tax=Penaeicola halotolerans TaxID=2793196 RepID=UPI001CF84076|nr:restriction endonuclease subunit S [Penaeicola halotolerans]
MEGLEISEVFFHELLKVETFRFDSEYFQKKYLYIDQLISGKANQFKEFNDLELSVDASAFYPSLEPYYGSGNFPFLRVKDVDTNIDYENCIRIPLEIVNSSSFKTLRIISKGDIVITKGGSIARVGLIEEKTAVTRDLIFIDSSRLSEIDYKFLFLYLLSSICYDQLIRSSSMTAQPHLTITLVRNLKLFEPSYSFKEQTVQAYNLSKGLLVKSREVYQSAEKILLDELGLKNFQPSQEPVNVKSFSESFDSSGRLDAEYYQIKYEQVVERIKSTNHDRLTDIVKIKKSIEPGSAHYSEEGLPFVRVSDYDKFGLSTPDKYLTDEFCKENAELIKKLKPKKETILFSKDGSVGTAYMLRKDADFITSSAILHLTVKDKTKIIPEYLTLALNSKLVQMQAERDAGGSIILHWRVSEIENVVVPVIDFDKQREIADLVEESFKLKKQSEYLLEVAKTAVEMAIEQDEETAILYINQNSI